MLTVRPVNPEKDRSLIVEAARADPYHAAIGLTGEHWLEDAPNTLFYEDEKGPVVALKTTSCVRADIQFLTQDHERNRNALLEGFWTYIRLLDKRGVKEIIFKTDSPEVATFFAKRFCFRPVSAGTFSMRIS